MDDNTTKIISDDTDAFKLIFERNFRIKKLLNENKYDENILKFYYEGFLEIDNKKISINNINVLGINKGEKTEYVLDFIDNKEPLPKNIKISEIIKMKDTSIFEILINKYKDKIKDNTMVFDEEMKKYLYSLEWDEKLHNLTPETHEKNLSRK